MDEEYKYFADEHERYFANTRIIHRNVKIGKNVRIFPNVYIGSETEIGEGTIIQYGAFIEENCKIGKYSRIGTNAVLRRKTNIGDYSIFGSLSASEGKNWVGNHVLIESQCHLTSGLIVEDYVFIAPLFIGANDPDILHERRNVKKFIPQAPHIKFGARLGINVCINPNLTIGRECLIGSSSLVTKDIPDFSVAYGIPAKIIRPIDEKYRLPQHLFDEFKDRTKGEFAEWIF